MSISTELGRIQADRNTIRTKLVELGMATSTDNLTRLAAAIEDLVNQGAVSVNVKEGESYTIPAGYHNGSGTVKGVTGGGNYALQAKSVTPTKKQQNITPSEGYYGLESVTVAPIPDAFQDVSSVTVTAGEVLTGKIFVATDGTVTTGTMPNVGAVNQTLTGTVVSYTIPKGYHSGSGKVTITLEEKTVTPTKETQTITPAAGKVLSKVTVGAIPDEYQDVSKVTATAPHVLEGEVFVDAEGNEVVGTMPDKSNYAGNGGLIMTLRHPSRDIPEGYHSGNGKYVVSYESAYVVPTNAFQEITGKNSAFLEKVTVEAIAPPYYNTSSATAGMSDILEGTMAYGKNGSITGQMSNNGDTSGEIDGISNTSVTIPAGYTSGGTVSLTSDIEEALAAI